MGEPVRRHAWIEGSSGDPALSARDPARGGEGNPAVLQAEIVSGGEPGAGARGGATAARCHLHGCGGGCAHDRAPFPGEQRASPAGRVREECAEGAS